MDLLLYEAAQAICNNPIKQQQYLICNTCLNKEQHQPSWLHHQVIIKNALSPSKAPEFLLLGIQSDCDPHKDVALLLKKGHKKWQIINYYSPLQTENCRVFTEINQSSLFICEQKWPESSGYTRKTLSTLFIEPQGIFLSSPLITAWETPKKNPHCLPFSDTWTWEKKDLTGDSYPDLQVTLTRSFYALNKKSCILKRHESYLLQYIGKKNALPELTPTQATALIIKLINPQDAPYSIKVQP